MPQVHPTQSEHATVGACVTLEDERAQSRVVVAPERGAIVTSFEVAGRELLYLDEATLLDPSKNVRGGIPILFPSPGKLEHDRWQTAGRAGSMKQHGFARTLPWRVVSHESTLAHARVTLVLESNAVTLAQYPWAFRAELALTLARARLRLTFRLHNLDAAPLPFALGYHPYFHVAVKQGASIDSRATRAFDNVQKKVVPIRGFDFTAQELDLHLLDHGDSTSALRLADGTRLHVRASSEFGLWVVWTIAGREFVCLEPWTAPGNALNTGERLLVVAAGAVHESWVEIECAGTSPASSKALHTASM